MLASCQIDTRVRDSVETAEREVRFHIGGRERALRDYSYSDIIFMHEMLNEKKLESYREKVEMNCFNAWQIIRASGYKKSWKQYAKAMGVDTVKKQKIAKDEKADVLKTAASIIERVQKVRGNVKA